VEDLYRQIILTLGDNINPEVLEHTPRRAAQAFEFLTKGYRQNLEEVINGAYFDTDTDEIILVKNIELYSLCEHHLLPFIGKCHVAYIPKGKAIGLSKIARVVDVFARRMQVQEKLTKQIADALMQHLSPRGVAVVIEAQHLCMMMRGVEKQNSVMTTSCVLGVFRDNEKTRLEFLSLIK
jgi:GTP cyclohydrolase I